VRYRVLSTAGLDQLAVRLYYDRAGEAPFSDKSHNNPSRTEGGVERAVRIVSCRRVSKDGPRFMTGVPDSDDLSVRSNCDVVYDSVSIFIEMGDHFPADTERIVE